MKVAARDVSTLPRLDDVDPLPCTPQRLQCAPFDCAEQIVVGLRPGEASAHQPVV
jgi:hypothetical protein